MVVASSVCSQPNTARAAAPEEKAPLSANAYVNAPELTGGIGWLNTDKPVTLKSLRGKLVLLDFWTFCCINCMHIMPDLHRLEQKYKNELVVIGVHSAKFQNEKDSANIKQAILRYDIRHPVVNDANFKIWQAYTVNAWPTLVLISPEGKILGQASGETRYEVLDKQIAAVLAPYEKQGKINKTPLHFALERDKVKKTELSFPGKILADADSGRLFISDSGHNRIVVSDFAGHIQDVIGSTKLGIANGKFESASFNHPQGMALHEGFLYIADTENHAIRRVDLKNRTVSTIAGDGHQAAQSIGPQGGDGKSTRLSSPWDLAFVGDKLYVAMAGAHQLWCLDLTTNKIVTIAGTGQEGIKDGPLQEAWLAQPSGLSVSGNRIYFADSEVSAIRQADVGDHGKIDTVIGIGLFDFGDKDGSYPAARLQHPLGVAFKGGHLYVADSYNHKIKVVDPAKKTAVTLAGTGKPGLVDGKHGQLSEPGGLSVAGDTLYIADTNNQTIRTFNLVSQELKTLNIVGKGNK